VFLFLPRLTAQTIVIDWNTKKMTSAPTKINQRTLIKIEVDHVNDVLYTYSIQTEGTPRENSDFDAIAKAFSLAGKGAGEGPGCPQALADAAQKATTDLGAALTAFFASPENHSNTCTQKNPCSLTLDDTRTIWTSSVAPKVTAAQTAWTNLQVPICQQTLPAAIQNLKTAIDRTNSIYAGLSGDIHTASTTVTVDPDVDYTITITELYKSSSTNAGFTVKFTPANDRLTLSGGALFSEIQNLGYSNQTAPNAGGTGTQNILAVSGRSAFSPAALALLNYQLPNMWKIKPAGDNWGITVSTGPVFRLGSKSDTSSFGYFAGLGIYLYHRFFITPGLHIGEFADFPPGFNAPGQVIPTGITTLTPVKRYTVRFAIGLSYKAKDFSGLGLTVSGSQGGSGTSPKPSTGDGSTNDAKPQPDSKSKKTDKKPQ
jgi:hypothetical protein